MRSLLYENLFDDDRHRYEMTYKGKGQLIFAGDNLTDSNLIWIVHSAQETSYR
jgi:hypothetical protein